MNNIDLQGRCAVITGGAQGIGRAIAERFLNSGVLVSLWDADEGLLRTTSNELSTKGKVHFCPVNVTDAEAVEQAAGRSLQVLGKIDILVANAGITGPNVRLWEYPVEAWRQVVDVNLHGIFHCCRAIVPFMIRQNYGRIVNMASIAGKEGNPNASAYSASKAGVIALTKSLGKELATI